MAETISEMESPEITDAAMLRLKRQGLWLAVRRENLIDQLMADCRLSEAAQEAAWRDFQRAVGWNGGKAPPPYADYREEELRGLALRQARLRQFRQERFGARVEDHFIKRKTSLDRLTYSLIRVGDAALARELYFRIHEDGEEFGRVASAYSQGPEAHTCGVIGPVARGAVHPALLAILQGAAIGEVQAPQRLGEWFVIARLEAILPATLDAAMQHQLLDELFEAFLQARLAEPGTEGSP